ncbi:response regulator transcription factor [Saccharibacillus alkalitolerans]|uniref:Response regulator n=1 Tax=Saccharibacillus alkalitolerans TaxID=2705290 RepID=A0ABX0F2I1_9BACL|nr:response regulator [Saccharibacillus alkalitolerans]NGZ74777.1 response regulator [Saccharibacillus alkalitolerans]
MYNVLLVDDEPLAIEGLKLMVDWEKYGFRIGGTCENGEEAIRQIRRDSPDLVVTDIRMPVMDGLQLIEHAREACETSALFVITSGYDDFDYARRAMQLGVSNYLTKPVMGDEAEEMLRTLSRRLEARARESASNRSRAAQIERRALAFALFGSEEQRREARPELERLSSAANSWIYVRLQAEAEWMPEVRTAVAAAGEGMVRCRSIEAGNFALGIVIGAEEADATEAARLFAGRLIGALPPESGGKVRLSAGRSVKRLDALRTSFQSAEEASRFWYFGGEPVVAFADVRSKELCCNASVLGDADRIAALTETGDDGEIKEAVAEAFARFEARPTLPELVETFATRVIVRCASICGELGGDSEETLRRSPLGGAGARGLKETKRLLERFCLDFRSEAARLRERSSGGVQAQVADFLRERYTETFTIRELAEKFYVHPVYLGQSFSRRYGTGIAEFVHELRIEEACRLLRESSLSSCAISEKLGYKTYQHFLKQFEKNTGEKPAEYRARASR